MIEKTRVLVVHNRYLQRGGEDSVVDSEVQLLRNHGHSVELFERSSKALSSSPLVMTTKLVWNAQLRREVADTLARFKPDVVHVHNTFPLISPAVYWAADEAGVPVVQTLHNFRLMCLNALFLREEKVCEDCMGRPPWRGAARGCYRGSRAASAALAGMLTIHRALGTYRDKVARYIALNEFCRSKFIAGGLPSERVTVKPNFVDFAAPQPAPRAGLLFVGRLSAEKGLATLARAMALNPDARMRVAGDGPDARALDGLAGVTKLGCLSAEGVHQEMSRAAALVVPSIWYETFGLVVIEAFACSTPAIVSRIGALAELVRDGETGLLFEPGNPHDLADKLAWAQAHPEQMAAMGRNAREEYVARFSAEVNYRRLLEIYDGVLAGHRKCQQ